MKLMREVEPETLCGASIQVKCFQFFGGYEMKSSADALKQCIKHSLLRMGLLRSSPAIVPVMVGSFAVRMDFPSCWERSSASGSRPLVVV